jgi:hypothetical protein
MKHKPIAIVSFRLARMLLVDVVETCPSAIGEHAVNVVSSGHETGDERSECVAECRDGVCVTFGASILMNCGPCALLEEGPFSIVGETFEGLLDDVVPCASPSDSNSGSWSSIRAFLMGSLEVGQYVINVRKGMGQ